MSSVFCIALARILCVSTVPLLKGDSPTVVATSIFNLAHTSTNDLFTNSHHYHSETSLDTQNNKSISDKFALLSRLDVLYELNMPMNTL